MSVEDKKIDSGEIKIIKKRKRARKSSQYEN